MPNPERFHRFSFGLMSAHLIVTSGYRGTIQDFPVKNTFFGAPARTDLSSHWEVFLNASTQATLGRLRCRSLEFRLISLHAATGQRML